MSETTSDSVPAERIIEHITTTFEGPLSARAS